VTELTQNHRISCCQAIVFTSFSLSETALHLWKTHINLIYGILTLSLPESVMQTIKVVLTFESVDEILWCDHSNEIPSAVLSRGTIYITIFYKTKFGICLEFWFWPLLGVKGLNLIFADNAVTSDIPEELLEVFSDGGQPGTKRPKDKVWNSMKCLIILHAILVPPLWQLLKYFWWLLFKLSNCTGKQNLKEKYGNFVSALLLTVLQFWLISGNGNCQEVVQSTKQFVK